MGYFSSPRVHRCVFQGTLDVELYEKLKSVIERKQILCINESDI